MGNSELQATLELSVEFLKFYNVDLFQRGYYQVRSHVKASPKIPIKVEVSLPRNQASNMAYPACIINGNAVTKTFQIMYRNEEVRLDDVINFRIHAIVEAGKVQETLEKLDIQLTLELWYTEEGSGLVNGGVVSNSASQQSAVSQCNGASQSGIPTHSSAGIECVSSRVLSLNLSPGRGLHYHLPVLFDYFHLSAVSITIHGALVALHQPYINSPRLNGTGNGKAPGSGKRKSQHQAKPHANHLSKPQSMDAFFFGNTSSKSKDRMSSARMIHGEVCSHLLASLESLQQAHSQFLDLLHNTSIEGLKAKIQVTDCHKRLHQLSEMVKSKKSEDEFLETACSDISQLCGELVVLWNNFINLFTGRSEISQHLARVHHHQRVKRFSEAFFLVDHPRKSALECVEAMYNRYAALSESLRTSDYLLRLPPLPVSCVDLDGDASTMPIIFEDVYRDEEQAHSFQNKPRRHSYSDVKKPDLSSSNEDIITALEALGNGSASRNGNHRRSPRPTSVPFNKSLLASNDSKDLMGSSMTTSLENPLSSLSSGYFSDSTSFKGKLQQQHQQPLEDIQVVEQEDDEPSILATKSFHPLMQHQTPKIPSDQGYSHLDWCANYNVAEEPDDVQGMKHSHSCQSMPVQNKVDQTSPAISSSEDSSVEPRAKVNTDQEALSKQLEFVRQKSRSTFLDRPRAKSEELMVVKHKFPHQMPDAQKKQLHITSRSRQRMQSDSCLQTAEDSSASSVKTRRKTMNTLQSPNLVQIATSKPEQSKVKILPPKAFRDGPSLMNNKVLEPPVMTTTSPAPASSVPMRRKAATANNNTDHHHHSTFSLSRLESKKSISSTSSGKEDCFLVDTTGDMLENKPIANTLVTDLSSTESQILDKLNSLVLDSTLTFVKAKEEFKKKSLPGILYSDVIRQSYSVPYFHYAEDNRLMWLHRNNGHAGHVLHLVVCVHGLDGNSADLRLIKTYLEMAMPGHNLDFLMSENNQGETFSDLNSMTDRLVDEILQHISNYNKPPTRISFVGHSLGTVLIRSAISRPQMAHLVPFFHTYLSLSGPHLGTLYNNSGLVNMGMWFMQKWKKSGSLHQLALKDATDIRKTFMYQLSQKSNLHMFRHVLLAGSTQDRYVPWHSARVEMCKASVKDQSVTGSAYREMVDNIISPIVSRGSDHCTLARFDIHHALPSNTNSLIGRAAHIAVLDSELFIEKFLIISILKYFQ